MDANYAVVVVGSCCDNRQQLMSPFALHSL